MFLAIRNTFKGPNINWTNLKLIHAFFTITSSINVYRNIFKTNTYCKTKYDFAFPQFKRKV